MLEALLVVGPCPQGWTLRPRKEIRVSQGSVSLPPRDTPFCGVALQVSGVGYNGNGTVCLLPSKEVIKQFSNVSVGKLVEVSVNRATVEINTHLKQS